MIEIDIDPNIPDRRSGRARQCAIATNLDIRGHHRAHDLEEGMQVIAVQDHSAYDEPDWVTGATIDEIRALPDTGHEITHVIYLRVDWDGFKERGEDR